MFAPTPPSGMRTITTDAFFGISAPADEYSAMRIISEIYINEVVGFFGEWNITYLTDCPYFRQLVRYGKFKIMLFIHGEILLQDNVF